MKKIFFLGILILLILPFTHAKTYGSGTFGSGLFGKGESISSDSSSISGSGGGSSKKIQFDVKILEIDSDLTPGDYFSFSYFIKGVGSINHDVIIDFWIEDLNGQKISSGSDVIYFEVNEEKTENASLLIPSGIESGIYQLKVKATYETITGESHRTIQIDVESGIVEQLFDISFFLEETLLKSSDELTAIVTLESFRTKTTDIGLMFIILDENENELYREQQVVSVQTERILRKSFVGLNLAKGKYTLVLETLYNIDVFDEFRQDFEIIYSCNLFGLDFGKFIFCWYWWILIIFLFLIFIIILFKKNRKNKKEMKKSKKENELKKTKDLRSYKKKVKGRLKEINK